MGLSALVVELLVLLLLLLLPACAIFFCFRFSAKVANLSMTSCGALACARARVCVCHSM
jgi:hypothetical protein